MPNKNNRNDRRPTDRDEARREGTDLDRRYGRIGISAVAAAARYFGPSEAKHQASTGSHEKREKLSA
jgi:predicted DNA-binding WGR domain protein